MDRPQNVMSAFGREGVRGGKRRLLLLMALALVVGLAVAACGGDDDSAAPPPAPEEAAPPPEEPAAPPPEEPAAPPPEEPAAPPPEEPEAPPEEEAAPEEEGWAAPPVTFVWADFGDPQSIDPVLGQDIPSFNFIRNVYEPLVEVSPSWSSDGTFTGEVVPRLATSWEVSSDGRTHTFSLREGVTFHDGSALDAESVKLSLDRNLGMGQGIAYLVASIEDVTILDPMTVAITSKSPDPFLPERLTKIGIVSGDALKANRTGPEDWAEDFFRENEAGSGPYELESWERGVRLTLIKNTDWWYHNQVEPWQPGSIDRLVMVGGETSARVQMMEQGDAQLMSYIPPQEALRLADLPGFTLTPWNTYHYDPVFYLNTQKPPFDNLKVRQAVTLAFDYEAMIDYYGGNASVPTGPMVADFPGGAADLEPFMQDLPQAKALLEEAGITPDKRVAIDFLVPSGFAQFAAGATIMQDSLKQLGIDASISETPFAQLIEVYNDDATSPHMTVFASGPFSLDPVQWLEAAYYTGALFNMSKYSVSDVDAMIDEIRTTLDEEMRNELLHDVQHRIREEAPAVWGARPQTVDAVPNYVVDYVYDPTDYQWVTKFYSIRIKEH